MAKMIWSFTFKHWGSTLLLGTTILILASGFGFSSISEISDSLTWFIIYLIFSAIYSIPTLIAYLLMVYLLIGTNIGSKWTKFILIFVTITGITLTTSLIDSDLLENLSIYYSLSSVVTGIFLKFEKT